MSGAVVLSAQQERAVAQFLAFEGPEFVLAGLAGTGKTTVLRTITERLDDAGRRWIAIAPTAKACRVLAMKGVPARTAHSVLYTYAGVDESPNATLLWDNKEETEADDIVVIVDETSMIDARLAAQIRSRARKILWVGDHGQLPPIGDDPEILSRPNVVLETIHRQAAESPILRLAYRVRGGEALVSAARAEGIDVISFGSAASLAQAALDRRVDVTLVAKNDLRNRFNAAYRVGLFSLDANPPRLTKGERVVGLRNTHEANVWNGEGYSVVAKHAIDETDRARDCVRLDLIPDGLDESERLIGVPCWWRAIGAGISKLQREVSELPRGVAVVDYGYALTTHKAQGSEFGSVVVVDDELPSTDMRRWRYTAVTRAARSLAIGAWA